MPIRSQFIPFLVAVLAISCSKEEKGYPFATIDAGVDVRLNDAFVSDNGSIAACGGIREEQGWFFYKDAAKAVWHSTRTQAPESVHTIEMYDDLHGWAGGGFLNIWETMDGGETWRNEWLGLDVPLNEDERPAIKTIRFQSENSFAMAGGENYNKGVLYYTQDNGESFDFEFLHNEMRGIHMSDSLDGIACGFGRLVTTSEGAGQWQDVEIQDDFYTGLVTYQDHVIMCTSTGRILKADLNLGGLEEVLKGNGWFNWSGSFNDMTQADDLVIAVGNEGYFAVSEDQGLNWNEYRLSEPLELFSVFVRGDWVWCASDQGKIIQFKLP